MRAPAADDWQSSHPQWLALIAAATQASTRRRRVAIAVPQIRAGRGRDDHCRG